MDEEALRTEAQQLMGNDADLRDDEGAFEPFGGEEVDYPFDAPHEGDMDVALFEGFKSFDKEEPQDDIAPSTAPTAVPGTGTIEDSMEPFGVTSSDVDWSKHDWSKRTVKPDSQLMWEKSTLDNLSHARDLIKHANDHHAENAKHIDTSSRRSQGGQANVHQTLRKKMALTNDLIKGLEDRHESVEDTIRQVGECLFQLQRAHRSKWAPLNVCERRLELRDKRPLQELIRDHCQEGLEHERQTLIEARQELADQVNGCREMLATLDNLKGDLLHDLSNKRHGLRIDRSCLSPTAKPIGQEKQRGADRVILPQLHEVANYALPPSPKDTDRGTGAVHEESRQMDTRTLITRAVQLEEDAMRLCNESDRVMLHTKRECSRASVQAQTSMSRRADETDDLKKKLGAQMREMDETIATTEMSLAKTKKNLEAHELPLTQLDRQFELRGRRESREMIRDHVHEELENHLDGVKKSVKILTTKWQTTKSLLEQMRSSRSAMLEDYKCKVQALKIDDACLKVTPKKAIELDRMDPRGGRCRRPAGVTPRREVTASPQTSRRPDSQLR